VRDPGGLNASSRSERSPDRAQRRPPAPTPPRSHAERKGPHGSGVNRDYVLTHRTLGEGSCRIAGDVLAIARAGRPEEERIPLAHLSLPRLLERKGQMELLVTDGADDVVVHLRATSPPGCETLRAMREALSAVSDCAG
jgi:hypothetical protein